MLRPAAGRATFKWKASNESSAGSARPLRMIGARGAVTIHHLAGVLIQPHALEHYRASDHVAT